MIKPPTVKNFIKSMYVCSTHGPSYMLDMRFLTPGRYFFNEELADKDVVIPETVVRLSTRKSAGPARRANAVQVVASWIQLIVK